MTGDLGIPTVELFDSSEEGLIFGVVREAASTQQGQQPQTQPPQQVEPGSETQQERTQPEEQINKQQAMPKNLKFLVMSLI